MKTAINLLKFVAIMLALAWLGSCGNTKKARIAEELKHVKFDLELLGGEIKHIDKQTSDFRFMDDMAFTTNNLSEQQLKAKRAKSKSAKEEYEELLKMRNKVFFKMVLLKVKYDSLKTEYDKY